MAGALRDLERQAIEEVTQPHNIPHALTRFIGREREIGNIRSLLAEHRLVTLTGPGGIGKSRVVMEVARTLARDCPGGAWFVELGALEDSELVPQAVANALKVREEARRPIIDTIADFIGRKQTLLVLDNCEHLTDACGELAVWLLQRCEGLQVLAATRQAIHVIGEVVWVLPPMSVPKRTEESHASSPIHYDSVRLFTDRAATALPGFALTRDNTPQVVQVCQPLDGIPLAMELAATRLGSLTLDQIAEKLEDRYQLLAGATRMHRPQHMTLRATMDWSFELLTERERTLFARLSIFRGGWSPEAAEEVCGGGAMDGNDLTDLIQRLVDQSIVQVDFLESTGVRYRLLETVRQYAWIRLGELGEAADMHVRHARFFRGMAERGAPELWGHHQVEWLHRLEQEHANLRAAMKWDLECGDGESALVIAGSLSWFWLRRGYATEGLEWLARARSTADSEVGPAAVEALMGEAFLAGYAGDPERAESATMQGLSLSECLQYTAGVALAHAHLSRITFERGEFDKGMTHAREAVTEARQANRPGYASLALFLAGTFSRLHGNASEAIGFHEEALEIDEAAGHFHSAAWALTGIGAALRDSGEMERAVELGEKGLGRFRMLDDPAGTVWAAYELQLTLRQCGDNDRALRLLREALEAGRYAPQVWMTTKILEGTAQLLLESGRPGPAARILGAAEGIRDTIGAPLPPPEQEEHDRVAEEVAARLDERGLGEAWTEGRSLAPHEAVDYALEILPRSTG